MRNKQGRILIAAGLLLGMAAAAYGQDGVRAQVPFSFAVRGRTLPAGTYSIERSFTNDPNTLELRSEQGAQMKVYAMVEFTGPEAGSKLVFDRYGEHYFLREVWTAQGRHVLGESREESRLARGARPAVVAVATGR